MSSSACSFTTRITLKLNVKVCWTMKHWPSSLIRYSARTFFIIGEVFESIPAYWIEKNALRSLDASVIIDV
jgi:hypothetical protein